MAKADIRFDLPNKEAISFFRAKGLAQSFAWQDLWEQEHQKAFTVAKMAHVDLLAETQRLVLQAQQEGWTRARFIEELKPRLIQAGWWGKREMTDPLTGEKRIVQLGSVPRINTILSTNLRTSRAAAQWQKIERQHEAFPYLKYHTLDHGPNRRPEHQRWDGLILRWDDPWWDAHYPPNGWGCKCSVTQISERALARLGKSGPDKAPDEGDYEWTNPRTGKTISIPNGIDPGWDYNPGKVGDKRLKEALTEKQAAVAEPQKAAPVPAVNYNDVFDSVRGFDQRQIDATKFILKNFPEKKFREMVPEDEQAAIANYTGIYFTAMNRQMRGLAKFADGKYKAEILSLIKRMASAIERSAMPAPVHVYRGGLLEKAVISAIDAGQVVTADMGTAFTSASLLPVIAETFYNTAKYGETDIMGAVVMEIHVAKGRKALPTYWESTSQHEMEIVLAPNSKVTFFKSIIKDGVKYIHGILEQD